MWLTAQQQVWAAVLGVTGLLGLGGVAWRSQHPARAGELILAAQWDAALRRARVVDVNRATAAELERLPQVGPALARRIVDDRQRRGRFRTAAELSRVDGIGPQTVAALAAYVTVEPSGE